MKEKNLKTSLIALIALITLIAAMLFITSAKHNEHHALAYTSYVSTPDEVEETVSPSELLPPDTSPDVL